MFGMILIGFEYKEDNKLPGTLIDLFRAKEYGKEIGIQNFLILSDITENKKDFREALSDGVNTEVLNFFDPSSFNRVFSLDELLDISDFVKKNDYLIVYYSGHCRDSMMILPSEEKLDFRNLESTIMRINERIELVFILDCCEFKNELISFCICPDYNPVSTNKGSLFSREIFKNKITGVDWLEGKRKRVLQRNNFLFIFDLNQVSGLQKYLPV